MTFRQKILSCICCIMTLFLLLSASVCAGTQTENELSSMIYTIHQLSNSHDLTSHLTNGFEKGNNNSDWLLFALARAGYNTDEYEISFLDLLDSRAETASETDKIRMALVCSSISERTDFIDQTLTDTALCDETVPIMRAVWWLILCNMQSSDNISKFENTRTHTQNALMSLQKSDGGFALTPTLQSDTDVTAMAIIALSDAYLAGDTSVTESVDDALEWLKTRQLDDGSFMGFGNIDSAETTAQVILALDSLGLSAQKTVGAFFCQENSPFSALKKYHAKDIPQLFAHSSAGPANEYATVQVLSAYIATYRRENGAGSYYDISGRHGRKDISVLEQSNPEQNTEYNSEQVVSVKNSSNIPIYRYVLYVVICMLGAAAVLLTLLRIRKNRRPCRQILLSLFIISISAALCIGVNQLEILSADDYYSNGNESVSDREKIEVTLSIFCDNAPTSALEGTQAKEMLPLTVNLTLAQGSSVYDALIKACQQAHIRMEHSSTGGGEYIEGIAGLYEKDCGDVSGWMYLVNGISADRSCSEMPLKEGDSIIFAYTLNLGEDLQIYEVQDMGENQAQ